MSDLNKNEAVQKQYKPSVHRMNDFIKERRQQRNANNRVITIILPKYAETLSDKNVFGPSPEEFVESHKSELIEGLLKQLELIDRHESKLTSSERRAVVDLWIKFGNKDEKENRTHKGA